MAEKILVVTTTVPDKRLRERLRDQVPEGAEVRVVSPATKVSPLDWLTNAEDDARAEATQAAERTAEALADGVFLEPAVLGALTRHDHDLVGRKLAQRVPDVLGRVRVLARAVDLDCRPVDHTAERPHRRRPRTHEVVH